MPQFSPNSDTISIKISANSANGCVVTFEVPGDDIADELRQLPQDIISHSEKGWQRAFDLMAGA